MTLQVLTERKCILKEDTGLDLNVSILLNGDPEGLVSIGVPIGTDAFIQNLVAKTCRAIIDDVEKLDTIQDGFIHYQLLRFCQSTRLQCTNSHILLRNRCVHVLYLDLVLFSGRLSSQDGDAQHQETAPLLLPQLNKFHEG